MFIPKRVRQTWTIGELRFVRRGDLNPEEESEVVSTMTAASALQWAMRRFGSSITFELMHRELRQNWPGSLGSAPRRQDILPDLLDAVRRGELVAFDNPLAPPPRTYIELEPEVPETPGPDIKTWIGVTLVDEKGKPLPDHTYRLVKPDGGVTEGELDSRSSTVVTGLDPGQCQVTFECKIPKGATGLMATAATVLADLTFAATPTVNPVIQPAKLVLVVPKVASNPHSGRADHYTHPKRQPITLKTSAAFDGTATFNCNKPNLVRFFTSQTGGRAVELDGISNVFGGTSLASGKVVYAEAVAASSAIDDIVIELSLAGGSKTSGPPANVTISNVELSLDICGRRASPQDKPAPLSQDDKIHVGSELVVQDKNGQFGRAQVIIRPVKPQGFDGELELKTGGSHLQVFRNEHRTAGEVPVLPFKIRPADVPNGGKVLWVEAESFAQKTQKPVLVLGLAGSEDQGDVVAVTTLRRIYLTFDDGPSPVTTEILDVLAQERAPATFFLNMAPFNSRPEFQYQIIRRILNEGHSIGNHGYQHWAPANRAAYGSAKPNELRDNFQSNATALQRLFEAHHDVPQGFPISRLQGDGRTLPATVQTVTKVLQVPHAGWAMEYAPAETAKKLTHLAFPVEGVPGVNGARAELPSRGAVIVLLHDAHWKGKKDLFGELVRALKNGGVIVPLVPVPKGLEAGPHGAEGVAYP